MYLTLGFNYINLNPTLSPSHITRSPPLPLTRTKKKCRDPSPTRSLASPPLDSSSSPSSNTTAATTVPWDHRLDTLCNRRPPQNPQHLTLCHNPPTCPSPVSPSPLPQQPTHQHHCRALSPHCGPPVIPSMPLSCQPPTFSFPFDLKQLSGKVKT